MGGPGLVTGVPLPADDRPFDDTPIHTADLPDTPIRDRNVPAEAWVEAPDALLAAAEGIPSADGRPVRIAYKRRLGGTGSCGGPGRPRAMPATWPSGPTISTAT